MSTEYVQKNVGMTLVSLLVFLGEVLVGKQSKIIEAKDGDKKDVKALEE